MHASTIDIYIHDENEMIPVSVIKQFKIFSSIFSQYPSGTLTISDPEGKLLSGFALRPGSILRIVATDVSESANPLAPPPKKTTFAYMIIVGLESDNDKLNPEIPEMSSAQVGPLEEMSQYI